MNILYLCDEYPPGRHGGIGTAVQLLARQMAKMGHRVVVAGFYDWGYGGEEHFNDEGVEVYRFRRGLSTSWLSKRDSLAVRIAYKLFMVSGMFQYDIQRSLLKYADFLKDIIARYNIDIMEMADFSDYGQFCKKYTPFPKLPVPTVVKLHSSTTYLSKEFGREVPQHIYEMDKHLIHQATAVSSVAAYTARKTAQYFGYTRRIKVLHNGIVIPTDISVPAKDMTKVVYTGALLPYKGIFQLMAAWNIVISKVPAARLYVYGKGNMARVQQELAREAQNSVEFKGHVSRTEIMHALSSAGAAVFPSYIESFALAPMEAMACGTAVVYTTRVSGPELIDDAVDGLLVDPDNVAELAEKILFLITHPQEADRIALAGKRKVESEFEIGIIAQKNIDFYKDVLSGSL